MRYHVTNDLRNLEIMPRTETSTKLHFHEFRLCSMCCITIGNEPRYVHSVHHRTVLHHDAKPVLVLKI
jgi:hypothetical protein